MAAKVSEPNETQAQNTEDTGRKRESSIQIVEFILGKERFAIDLFDVKEVVEYTTITRLPNVPAYIK
jgi:purine-binding chemotaxis protein CheW